MQQGLEFTKGWHLMWFFWYVDLILRRQKHRQHTQSPLDQHTHINICLHHLWCAHSSQHWKGLVSMKISDTTFFYNKPLILPNPSFLWQNLKTFIENSWWICRQNKATSNIFFSVHLHYNYSWGPINLELKAATFL